MTLNIYRIGTRKNACPHLLTRITEKNTPLDVKNALRYCEDSGYKYQIKLSNGWIIKSFTAFETLTVYDFIIAYFIKKGEYINETTQ